MLGNLICSHRIKLIAVRYNDVRHKTNKIEPILEKYKEAWHKKGMVTLEGLYVNWLLMSQDMIVPPRDIGLTAW